MYAGGPGNDPTWGLMGNVAQPSAMPMTGLIGPQQIPTQNFQQPGQWSQLAYQMAGRPNQNPFQGLTLPPETATSPSGGGATALGGTALGILGALAQGASGNKSGGSSPLGSVVSTIGSKLGGLLGGGGSPAAGSAANSASSAAGDTLFSSGTADSTAGLGGTTTAFGDGATGTALGTTTTFGDAAGIGGDAALSNVGVDAATADPSIAGLGSGAGSSSGAGSAMLAALPWAAAALATAAPIYGATQAPYDLKPSWYQGLNSILAKGPGNTPQQQGQYWGAVQQASASNDSPEFALLKQYGIQPAAQGLLSGTPYSTNGSPSFMAGGQGGGTRPTGKL